MAKTSLQVRIPDEIESALLELAPDSRSAFVREAIEEKIRREKAKRLEQAWIQALKDSPEDVREAKRWVRADAWGPR
ncbi:MAG: hypothetical protein HYY84_16435 [Deltaproteobacteria bacterium]|nr:hypothetical protein [Deltaproteobacteria bacterium]